MLWEAKLFHLLYTEWRYKRYRNFAQDYKASQRPTDLNSYLHKAYILPEVIYDFTPIKTFSDLNFFISKVKDWNKLSLENT